MTIWKVGNLACCIDDRVCPHYETNCGLVFGRVYEVTGVITDTPRAWSRLHGASKVGLIVRDCNIPSNAEAISSLRFRKVIQDGLNETQTRHSKLDDILHGRVPADTL